MNNKVRSYLIQAARSTKGTVTYGEVNTNCNLNFDLGNENGKRQLSIVLGEVSEYEDRKGRPLVSAVAVYKHQQKGVHGNGFYKIAEELGKGDWKTLKINLFGIEQMKASLEFWRNDENYSQFAHLDAPKKASIIDLLQSLVEREAKNTWETDYLEITRNVERLRDNIIANPTLAIDDDRLYANLHESIQSYSDFLRRWLFIKENGVASRGQSILSTHHLDVITGDEDFKEIARNVILNPSVAMYNLMDQWWRNNTRITNNPLLVNRALAACNPYQLSSTVHGKKFWKVAEVLQNAFGFRYQNEPGWNWYAANVEVSRWLDQELFSVLEKWTDDRLEKAVWRNIFVWLLYVEYAEHPNTLPNQLVRKPIPTQGWERIPESKREFKGRDVDYEDVENRRKELGDAGEGLVLEYEKARLINMGRHDLAEKVKIEKDGKGYDVMSFGEDEGEIYIEVKTTIGSALAPFYLSANEVAFMRQHGSQYRIFRVYHYDEQDNSGKFFEIEGEVYEKLLMEATHFKVWLK